MPRTSANFWFAHRIFPSGDEAATPTSMVSRTSRKIPLLSADSDGFGEMSRVMLWRGLVCLAACFLTALIMTWVFMSPRRTLYTRNWTWAALGMYGPFVSLVVP